MRNILRIFVDCLLVGMVFGILLMVLLVVADVGGLQGLLARVWLGGPAVLMIAVISGMLWSSAWFVWRIVQLELREDREDYLRRKFLIPAQRRRR
jgi:hypothetical protein